VEKEARKAEFTAPDGLVAAKRRRGYIHVHVCGRVTSQVGGYRIRDKEERDDDVMRGAAAPPPHPALLGRRNYYSKRPGLGHPK
jgi:hypothetical protein